MCNTNTDCGTCEHCQQTDDYGPAWRNPLFVEPGQRPPAATMSGPLAPEQPTDVHAPALTRDGFSEALRALGRDGGEHV